MAVMPLPTCIVSDWMKSPQGRGIAHSASPSVRLDQRLMHRLAPLEQTRRDHVVLVPNSGGYRPETRSTRFIGPEYGNLFGTI